MLTCSNCGVTYYSTGEVADILGLAVRTIQRYVEAGRFPHAIQDSTPPGKGPRWLIPAFDLGEARPRERVWVAAGDPLTPPRPRRRRKER